MIQSPYKQNIEIIKGFFRKPIVLVLVIMSFVSIAINLIMNFINPFGAIVQKAINDYNLSNGEPQFNNGINIGGSVSVTTILFAISFLLFYLFSKKEDKNLSAPSMMFKVLAIIELVFMCIATVFVIAGFAIFGILIFASANVSDIQVSISQLTAMSTLYIILLVIVIPVIIIALLTSIAQLQFANSIRKSINSIYLYRKGALMFGILHYIFAGLTLPLILFEIVYITSVSNSANIYLSPIQISAVFVQNILSIAFNIIIGIVAVSYSSYIKKVSMKFQSEAPVQQTAPAVSTEQAPVVTYQPASAAPMENNPYAPQPQPTPIAQQPVPQAPVREDFAAQPQVYAQPIQEVNPAQTQPSVEQTPEESAPQAPVQQEEPAPEPPAAPVQETPAPEKPKEDNQPVVKFCTECGKPVGPDDYFCNNCGKEIIRNI